MVRMGVVASSEPQREIPQYDRYAIASLVLGILGLLLPFVGTVPSILGIIFSRRGLKSRKVGMARVALVVSILGISLWVGLVIWFFVYIITGGEFM